MSRQTEPRFGDLRRVDLKALAETVAGRKQEPRVQIQRDLFRAFIDVRVMPLFWVLGGEAPDVWISRRPLEALVDDARELLRANP